MNQIPAEDLTVRLDHLDQCIDKVRENQADYHDIQEGRHKATSESLARLEAGLSEFKAQAKAAFAWTSTEEKQREEAALIEAGRQIEREKWLAWVHKADQVLKELWNWVGKPAIGAGAAYLAYYLRLL